MKWVRSRENTKICRTSAELSCSILSLCDKSFFFFFFEGTLPSPKETVKGNIKTVTEYKIDDEGKKVKVRTVLKTGY